MESGKEVQPGKSPVSCEANDARGSAPEAAQNCPYCTEPVGVPIQNEDTFFACPHCQKKFHVPGTAKLPGARQKFFILGLAIPLAIFAIGHIPGLHGIYDRYVLGFVYRIVLHILWIVLAVTGFLTCFRQNAAGFYRSLLMFVIGLIFSTLLVFDCWYFAPYCMAIVVAMTLWRIRWLWWSRCYSVAKLSGLFITLVLVGMTLDWNRLIPAFDNRFGFGMEKWSNLVSLICLVGMLAAVVCFWFKKIIGKSGAFYRALLADLITRELRCCKYFDAVRKVTPCIHPLAVNKPASECSRLSPCTTAGSLISPKQSGSGDNDDLINLQELNDLENAQKNGCFARWRKHSRAQWQKLHRQWQRHFGLQPMQTGKTINPPQKTFPDVNAVPAIMNTAWKAAETLLRSTLFVRIARACWVPSKNLHLPSDIIREMLTEGAQHEYDMYLQAISQSLNGDVNLDKADAWQYRNLHFGRMLLLYEASIEADYYFFLPPSALPRLVDNEKCIEQLKSVLEDAINNFEKPPSEDLASTVINEAAIVWQRVYARYLDLWFENIDRLVVGLGKDMFDTIEELHSPVSFAQLTINLIACREEISRLQNKSGDSVYSLAADLALWLLARKTSSAGFVPGKSEILYQKANQLLVRCFSCIHASLTNKPKPQRKGANPIEAAKLRNADVAELAVASVAYAWWQGACGNWDAAFRPLFLFSQFAFKTCSTAQPGDQSVDPLLVRASIHAMLRTAVHIKAMQALRAFRHDIDEEYVPPEVQEMQMSGDLDFGKHVSLESSVAMFLCPNAICLQCSHADIHGACQGGVFVKWNKYKDDALLKGVGNHALGLLGNLTTRANADAGNKEFWL